MPKNKEKILTKVKKCLLLKKFTRVTTGGWCEEKMCYCGKNIYKLQRDLHLKGEEKNCRISVKLSKNSTQNKVKKLYGEVGKKSNELSKCETKITFVQEVSLGQ